MSLYLKFPRDPKLIGSNTYTWWSIDENLRVYREIVEGKEEARKKWEEDVKRIASIDWEASGLKEFKII